jgi:proton-coupled amino acid transporter
MMMYPPSGIIEKMLLGPAAASPANGHASTEAKAVSKFNAHCKLMLRSVMVLATGLIAVGCPGFGDFVSLVGSSICALLALILPALFHIVLMTKQGGKDISPGAMAVDVFILVFGMIFGVLGTLDAVERLVGAVPSNTAGAAI